MSSAIPGAIPNLVSLRDSLRQDLHDSPADKWADTALERHILRAVAEYSQAYPDPQKTTLTAAPNSRDLAIASLADLVRIEAVEWKVDQYPRQFVAWQAWGTTLTMLVDSPPQAADSVYVYWGRLQACTTASCSVPAADLDLVLTGAAGYAAQEWATFATNRVNVDRAAVERYAELARRDLEHFHRELARRPRRGRVLANSLKAPVEAVRQGDVVRWG